MGSASQTLIGNVGQLLGEEYRQLRGVREHVAELRNDLATMNALFRMQSEADEGAVDHFDQEWMKQVRELGYDSEDCVDLYRLRVKTRLKAGMCAQLTHLLTTLLERRRLAGEIRALRSRAFAISERHARYGVNREALRPSLFAPLVQAASSSSHPLLREDDPKDHQLFGMVDQTHTLAKELMERVDGERRLKVFSIVGFGGVGKTTLAMQVCRQLEEEFPCQAMVSVSQAFEPSRDCKVLLKRVLQQVVKPKMENERGVKEEGALGNIDAMTEDELYRKLRENGKEKRYVYSRLKSPSGTKYISFD
ncbi:unnamed protein product [Urochloa humidicola]